MVCKTAEEWARLKEGDEFKDWVQKIKNDRPEKTDEDIEEMLRTFIAFNNGNFPGRTPFGGESQTFKQLVKINDGNEVAAMEIYQLLFGKDFIENFGDWCGATDTEGMTDEQIQEFGETNQKKLDRAALNEAGEPALFFVNSVNHLSSHAAVEVVYKEDQNLPFKIIIENGEAHVTGVCGRSVQSGSITFVVMKNYTAPFNSGEDIKIDGDEIDKLYDFNSENKGFSDKRLSLFLTQSSKDLCYISKRIGWLNKQLKNEYSINNRDDAIAFIRITEPNFIFDEDPNSPFGGIQLMTMSKGERTIWQVISPEGIFYNKDRYNLGTNMPEKAQTYVDRLAHTFFINSGVYGKIKNYITGVVDVIKPDSHLKSPMVDYYGNRFVLKPSSDRTQHNIKTEFGLAYAVQMYNDNQEQFTKYLNWAKQFPEISQNSVGTNVVKDVNMVGNLIGFILSGSIIDGNYYTAHSFDQSAIEQALFVSKHQSAIRDIVKSLKEDISDDIPGFKLPFPTDVLKKLSKMYDEIDFSNITDNISRNRTVHKISEDQAGTFCDTIDSVKAAYGYRRNDSGSKKAYDATEYTKVAAAYEQLNQLNKDIKEYLINNNGEGTVSGESLEKLISRYFTCIDTIVNIMEYDISNLEDFIWNTPEKYTPDYYSSLLYFDRSIIKMYKEQKVIIEKLFNLDSENSDLIQKSLYNIFSQSQVTRFEELRKRYYDDYSKLSSLKTRHNMNSSLDLIVSTMIEDAVDHIVNDWCDKNLKCLTEREERMYRENLKLDLEGHINAGMPLDTAIGGASSSGHSIINVLYRIIQTQQNRSNLLIKQKGDSLMKQFKSALGKVSPFNQCKIFCETVDGQTTGYFIRDVNYGMYYRAKVAKQRELLKSLPNVYTIDESKSTKTKLFIEWGVGSEEYQNQFLNEMDLWIEKNANRRYKAEYYIKRRSILGQDRLIDGNIITVGNEAANRQNTLRRQIDGIKNRYRDKETGVFLPSKVPPVQRKILDSLERQMQNLSSVYETYTNSDGRPGIREKTGLDLAIALNIQDWNKYIQDKRAYGQDVERYNDVRQKLEARVSKDITKEDLDAFDEYYHRLQAKQEYYDALEQIYEGGYGEYQEVIDDIRSRRRSILARVKHGKKGLLQFTNLDELTDAEWNELKNLDIKEQAIKSKLPKRFDVIGGISTPMALENKSGESFVNEHIAKGILHTYVDNDGESHIMSVYYTSIPSDEDMREEVLIDEFSVEDSEYMQEGFDPTNPSYEQPLAFERGSTHKKLYKNDKYDELKQNEKVFKLYETFLQIMQEANQMFGYAAISSNYKLPQVYERAASVYIGRGCNVFKSFYYQMKRDFLIDERDLDRSYTSDVHADNSTSGKLRKRFVEMLSDPEHISTDLVYSVMAYYMTACRYSDKQDVQAQCELINRKIHSNENTNQQLKTQADNTIETFLFENTMNTDNVIAAGFEKFAEHTTSVMLKWKLKTVIKAFLDGYRLLTNVYLSDKWNMRGHFLASTSKAISQTFSSIRSSIDIMDYNLSEALMSLNNMNIQSYIDANKTKFTRAYYKAGMMPMLTAVDHVTTKSIMLAVYDSIRLYTNPDGTRQFLNEDEFINMYKRDHPELSDKQAEKEAKDLFWGNNGTKVVTLYDAYQLGERDKNGNIKKGTEHILNIKPEYRNMFSDNEKENQEQWDIIQTRVTGQLNLMAASINGFKPEDAKAGNVMRKWYLKPIFQIRSFLIANYNELFKHSITLQQLSPDTSTRNTNEFVPKSDWSSNNGAIQWLNRISSEREMYNVLTGTKDVGYYFGTMSFIRKCIENLIIYFGSIKQEDPEFKHITKLEMISAVNAGLVLIEAGVFYNAAVFIGGLLCCLLGQGSNPDEDDEWFLHWFLWMAYDISASLVNDTLVNFPTGDTIIDIFRNIMAVIPALEQFKKSLLHSKGASDWVWALFGDTEAFEDPSFGTNDSPFNLQKSGKWQGEMYGKRWFYDTVQNAPWLIAPWYFMPEAWAASQLIPDIPISNIKESFSAPAAKAKASFTVNNLSPVDYFSLGTPSRSDESWNKFHDYGPTSAGAAALNSLIGGQHGEEEILDFIRSVSKSPYSPIPNISPVDKVERAIPLGRQYD